MACRHRRDYAALVALVALAPAIAPTADAQVPPPALTVNVRPSANAAGWHNTPVSISFPCTNPAAGEECRPPVLMDRDGRGQHLEVPNGADGRLRVSLDIDQAAPIVELLTPRDGLTTSADRIELTGRAQDALSGLRWVACNGLQTRATNDSVRCTVPLSIGVNNVLMHAMDVAGNSASAAVRIIRAARSGASTVVPSSMTINTHHPFGGLFELRSASGTPATDVTWTAHPAGIVTLETYGAAVVATPTGEGRVTLTARSGAVTASATLTVLADADVPAGTTTWAVAPLRGRPIDRFLKTAFVNDRNVTAVLVSEPVAGQTAIRTISIAGGSAQDIWHGDIQGRPVSIDRAGGVLAEVGTSALARYASPGDPPSWRFDTDYSLGDGEVDEDGRIYVVEQSAEHGAPVDTRIAVLDGASGRASHRILLPPSSLVVQRCDGTRETRPSATAVGALVGLDAGVLATVMTSHVTHTVACDTRAGQRGRLDVRRTLAVVRITVDGVEPVRDIWRWQGEGPDTPEWIETAQDAVAGPAIPAGGGELVVLWRHITGLGDGALHITRATPDRLTDLVPETFGRPWGTLLLDVFEQTVIHLTDGGTLAAIDSASGRARWTMSSQGRPVLALADGHVVVNDQSRGALVELTPDGQVAGTLPARLRQPEIILRDSGILHGIDAGSGAFVEVAIDYGTLGGAYAVLDLAPLPTRSTWLRSLAELVRH